MKNNGMAAKVLSLIIIPTMLCSNFVYARNTVKKDESVYVTLNQNGKAKDTIVSDWLHSDSGINNFEDKSILTNIVNIKGNETPNINGDRIVWNSPSNDIFYQGTTTKSLPLEVDISYFLDRAKVNSADIAGKSGKVEMRLDLKNNDAHKVTIDGKSKTIYTPFTTIAIVNLPIDTFTNVKVNSGEVFSDGNNQIVAFAALPGLKESLGIKDNIIDLPENLIITADASNFKMGPIMITTTPDIPDIKELRKANSLSELTSGIAKLKDYSSKLCEGAAKLAAGQKEFNSNFVKLKEGTNELSNGLASLSENSVKIAYGAKSAYDASLKLSTGIKIASLGAAELSKGQEDFSKGALSYSEGAKKFASGAKFLADGASNLPEKTKELSDGLNKLSDSTGKLKEGEDKITLGAEKSIEGIKSLREAKEKEIKSYSLMLDGIDFMEKIITSLEAISGAKDLSETLYQGLEKQKTALEDLKNSGNKYIDGLNQLESGIASIKEGSKTLSSNMKELQNGQKNAADGAKQLADGTAGVPLAAKILDSASNELSSGAESLAKGANDLGDGTQKFSTGSKLLINGSEKLSSGLSQLSDGTDKLSKGASQLSKGSVEISTNTRKFLDASKQLLDGSNELSVNMKKFNDEGIVKLDTEINDKMGNIDEILKTKDEIIKLSDDYGTFTGCGDNMDSTVKFIMKTDEIKLPEVKEVSSNTTYTPPVKEKKGLLSWIRSLF